jgi:hypothetical protein
MHGRNILGVAATFVLGLALVPGVANAQQKSIKDQLVGAWTLLLVDGVNTDGTHVPAYGPNPIGTLMFSPTGRYALEIMRADRALFASNNQDTGTAAENKAEATGTLSYFGTYTVDEPGKTLNLRVEGSSFPNWQNTTQKRLVTGITDEVLTWNTPNTPNPAQGLDHAELVWKKVK